MCPDSAPPEDQASALPFQAQIAANHAMALHLNARAKAGFDYLTKLRDVGVLGTLPPECTAILALMLTELDDTQLPRLVVSCSLGWLTDHIPRSKGHIRRMLNVLEVRGLLVQLVQGGKRGIERTPSTWQIVPMCAPAQRARQRALENANRALARRWTAPTARQRALDGARRRAVGNDTLSVSAASAAAANTDTAAAAECKARLQKEGFDEAAAAAITAHPNCTLKQIDVAAARWNARTTRRKNENRLGYLRKAIEERYLPPMSAEERAMASKPPHVQDELGRERQHRAELSAKERTIDQALKQLTEPELLRLVELIEHELPDDPARVVMLKQLQAGKVLSSPLWRAALMKHLQPTT